MTPMAREILQLSGTSKTEKGDPPMTDRVVNPYLAAIAMAALLACATGCGMIEKPSAHITGVKMQDISLTEATMLFDVEVGNPYSVPLPMSNVDYALSSQDQSFLTGLANLQGTVPAGGSKTIGVPVRINYLRLINAVQGARPGATIPYKADMGLSVEVPAVGPVRVPMSKRGELSIPTASGLLERLKDQVK
ncbi:MAG TPA: LEA type 2 family protein [Phycisphaerae bacterium]|nr:LEA type 2 family protein [Phycisphaerae bacterium]